MSEIHPAISAVGRHFDELVEGGHPEERSLEDWVRDKFDFHSQAAGSFARTPRASAQDRRIEEAMHLGQ